MDLDTNGTTAPSRKCTTERTRHRGDKRHRNRGEVRQNTWKGSISAHVVPVSVQVAKRMGAHSRGTGATPRALPTQLLHMKQQHYCCSTKRRTASSIAPVLHPQQLGFSDPTRTEEWYVVLSCYCVRILTDSEQESRPCWCISDQVRNSKDSNSFEAVTAIYIVINCST